MVEQIVDCVAVAEWLAANPAAEFGSGTLLIGGVSAGAHLPAAILLHLRTASVATVLRFVAAALHSDPYDFGCTPSA